MTGVTGKIKRVKTIEDIVDPDEYSVDVDSLMIYRAWKRRKEYKESRKLTNSERSDLYGEARKVAYRKLRNKRMGDD